jgi:hypothetical protein
MPEHHWKETAPEFAPRPGASRRRRWWLDPLFVLAVAVVVGVSAYFSYERFYLGKAGWLSGKLMAGVVMHVVLIGMLLAGYRVHRAARRRKRRSGVPSADATQPEGPGKSIRRRR